MPYMVTFTINIPQMLAYAPYMDPMGMNIWEDFRIFFPSNSRWIGFHGVFSDGANDMELTPGGTTSSI